MNLILSIDQSTSGSKAIIFNQEGDIICEGRSPLRSYYTEEGFVEQDPSEIFKSVLEAVEKSLVQLKSTSNTISDIKCCGISNQRETFLLWDKDGNPITNAIVWQCKRSIDICKNLKSKGKEVFLRNKTGLYVDPYFSGTKLLWLIENIREVKEAIESGDAYFGTVDTWILYKLTSGESYKTDFTNASRTLLFNLKELTWDIDILREFKLEKLNLPQIAPSSGSFGETNFNGILKSTLPITSMIGDSHAASFGEGCFKKGDAKATMGTGASILLNSKDYVDPGRTSLISTICWSTGNEVSYGLEGVIVSCGSTINWMIENLGIIKSGQEATMISEELENSDNVFLVPAFSGLGAPWWSMEQKAQIVGLTFGSNYKHIVRAGLESIAYLVTSIINEMNKSTGSTLESIVIDGGVSASSFITQLLADLNSVEIFKCPNVEASAFGAALLAGLGFGIYDSIETLPVSKYNNIKILPKECNVYSNYEKWLSIIEELL